VATFHSVDVEGLMITVQHKVIDYKLVTGDPQGVSVQVSNLLGRGWKLYGSPFGVAKGYYAQAMVEIEDNWRGDEQVP
jgi:hypothetical protein